jgi:hypothetical protein
MNYIVNMKGSEKKKGSFGPSIDIETVDCRGEQDGFFFGKSGACCPMLRSTGPRAEIQRMIGCLFVFFGCC